MQTIFRINALLCPSSVSTRPLCLKLLSIVVIQCKNVPRDQSFWDRILNLRKRQPLRNEYALCEEAYNLHIFMFFFFFFIIGLSPVFLHTPHVSVEGDAQLSFHLFGGLPLGLLAAGLPSQAILISPSALALSTCSFQY